MKKSRASSRRVSSFGRISIMFSYMLAIATGLSDIIELEEGYGVTWMYFPDGDGVPHRISLEMPIASRLKFSVGSEDIEYRLYMRSNVENYTLLNESAELLNESNKDQLDNISKTSIKIITHGWESTADKSAVINIKNAYLKMQDVIVIAIDWSPISESIMYPVVAFQTRAVGKLVGNFLDTLHDTYNVTGDQIHLIGHSLGAHIMGNAGARTKMNISRITGLDPARPLFEFPEAIKSDKLDSSDADFVDVIHTCAGVLGFQNATGDADFYPNRGEAPQPGCFDVKKMMEACSHSRSHILFTESILYPDAFPAYKCNNFRDFVHQPCYMFGYMGESVNRSVTGKFYLTTNDVQPFGRGLIQGITN